MCTKDASSLEPDQENVGALVTWHYTVSLSRPIDERGSLGIVIGIEEKYGRPGAWVMWSTHDKPTWTPTMMLRKVDDTV